MALSDEVTPWAEDPDHTDGSEQSEIPAPEPAADTVREELERILASPDFAASERASGFLRFVVEETLAGRAHLLKAYVIGTRLLSRRSDFDPTTDPIVRTQASRVRRLLDHYYLTDGSADPIKIELPAGTYRPLFRANAPSQTVQTLQPETSEDDLVAEPLVAVVARVDAEMDAALAAFVRELLDELIMALSRFEGFRVLPLLQGGAHAQSLAWLENVSRGPGTAFLLSYSASRSEHRIKINALLQEAANGEVLWSEAFLRDSAAENTFEIQSEISRRTACQLLDRAGVVPRYLGRETAVHQTGPLSIHRAIAQYITIPFVNVRSREQFLQFGARIESAVQHAPNNAFVNATLALVCLDDYTNALDTMEQPIERALVLARKAVALNPASQTAQGVLAYVHAHRGDYAESLVHLETCLEINPDASFLIGQMGYSLALAGNWERALELIRRAMDLNPYYMRYLHVVTFLDFYRQGMYGQALAETRLFYVASFYREHMVRAAALGKLGLLEEGRAAINELLNLRPDFPAKAHRLIMGIGGRGELLDDIMDGLVRAGLPTPLPAHG